MIYDALVIGGGPAGASLATLLARAGWSVALVEKAVFPRRKVCGEFVSATTLPLLRVLGLEQVFLDLAGPPVREVGIYAGRHTLRAPMPVFPDRRSGWGRALGREYLDLALLEGAAAAGVDVRQACTATAVVRDDDVQICTAKAPGSATTTELAARIVIAAHGSWNKGKLATQADRREPRPSDLLAFKAHFTDAALPVGLMPLLAFPGGYGGMVQTDEARLSLSCCIRRDVLQRCRRWAVRGGAGHAVLAHIMDHCAGVKATLAQAQIQERWLSAGPIRPGIRGLYHDGVFSVGNAAGEAHPVIAEGISMAMQGAWILAEQLAARRAQLLRGDSTDAGRAYSRHWRRSFARRIHLSGVFAHLAMSPAATEVLLPLFRYLPSALTMCTGLSGKVARTLPASL